MSGLALPAKLVSSSHVLKEGFTDTELARIFEAITPYRTHHDVAKVEWYWAVMLLAHSGCRATEVLELLLSDIQQEDGIWFFNVVGTGEGGEVKNRSSIRQVHIHSNRIKAGILEWYQ